MERANWPVAVTTPRSFQGTDDCAAITVGVVERSMPKCRRYSPREAHSENARMSMQHSRQRRAPIGSSNVAIRSHQVNLIDACMKGNLEPAITFAPSAGRHGIDPKDAIHAYLYAIREWNLDEGLTMHIGPSTRAALLEVGTVTREFGVQIIHAMPARQKFLRGIVRRDDA